VTRTVQVQSAGTRTSLCDAMISREAPQRVYSVRHQPIRSVDPCGERAHGQIASALHLRLPRGLEVFRYLRCVYDRSGSRYGNRAAVYNVIEQQPAASCLPPVSLWPTAATPLYYYGTSGGLGTSTRETQTARTPVTVSRTYPTGTDELTAHNKTASEIPWRRKEIRLNCSAVHAPCSTRFPSRTSIRVPPLRSRRPPRRWSRSRNQD